MRRTLMIGLVVAVATALTAPAALGRLLAPGERLMGMSYEQWDIKWGQAQAKRNIQSENSLIAVRGNKCGLQIGKAWLLPVSITPTPLTFTCAIPRGLHLVFPVAGIEFFLVPPGLDRFEDFFVHRMLRLGFKVVERFDHLPQIGEAHGQRIAVRILFEQTLRDLIDIEPVDFLRHRITRL